MGNRGRFGKYGEKKRIERLRQAKARTTSSLKGVVNARNGAATYKKKAGSRERASLRPAGAADMHYIQSLSKKVFEQYGRYEHMVPFWFDSGKTMTILALSGKQPVGFAMLGPPANRWYFHRASELMAIAVEPARQRLGIGRLLMREIEKEAKKLRVETLVLHTALGNRPGQRFFEELGFISSQIKKGFYPQGQDALVMYKGLLPNNT